MRGYGLSLDRVVAVVVALDDGTERVSSGYLVSAGRVLTAEHATRHRDPTANVTVTGLHVVQVATGQRAEVDRASIVADAGLDVAVLDVRDALGWPVRDATPVAVWAVERGEPGLLADCVVIGLPRFAYDPGRGLHGHAELHAGINQTDGRETGHLLMRDPTLHGVHDPDDASRSGWNGLSGALVFYQGRALGVVVAHHPPEGDNAVSLIGFERIVTNGQLRDLLGLDLADALPVAAPTSGAAAVVRPVLAGAGQVEVGNAGDLASSWVALSGTVLLPSDILCRSMAMNPSGTVLAAAGDDGTITTLRYDGKKQRLPAHARTLTFASEWDCWFSGAGHIET